MKRYMRVFSIALICVVLFGCIYSVSDKSTYAKTISGGEYDDLAVDPSVQGEGFSTELYDNQNGLPTSEANAIAETKEGFIWIGSYSGLIRYDGHEFERIDSTYGITSVVSLFVDSKDRLWIGTNDNGVGVMEQGRFTLYGFEGKTVIENGESKLDSNAEKITVPSIRSITEDMEGNIYIATAHGLYRVGTDMELKAVDEKQLNEEYINELRVSAEGTIYGETSDGDIFTIKNGNVTFFPCSSFGIGTINCVLPDPENEGYIYLGTVESEIYHGKLDGEFIVDNDYIDVSPLKCIASIEKFKNQLWFCADNGIGVLNDSGVAVLRNIPMNNSVEHILVDYEGNLWFTSSRQGILKIVPNRFSNLFERYGINKILYDKYGINTTVVNSTCILGDKLFIGTDTGLIVVDDNNYVDEVPIKVNEKNGRFNLYNNLIELLSGVRIRSIIKDSQNRLWFSTYSNRGLILYDNGNVIHYDSDSGLPSNKVRTVYERADGVIMVACSGGMAMIDNGEITEVYDQRWGLSNTEILAISQADNGEMVIGTDGNGIYIINGHNVRNLSRKDGLSSGVVMRIKRDAARKIFWIVTSNSLAYMDDSYNITTIKNFPYSNNFDLYENSHGDMWVLSSNGIYVVPADELLENGEIKPVFFSMANGLPCVATANSYSAIKDNGNLYIAGTTGVAKVNIEDTRLDVSNIKMAVPYLVIDEDQRIYPDQKGVFQIPSYANKITIYGHVFTYSLVNPQITYWLDGFDEKFTTISSNDLKPISYTNLDGGKYHFMMILQDAFGKGSKQLDVAMVKSKAFYEESWFRLLIVLASVALLSGFIVFVVKKKTKALAAKNEQSRIFINEMTQALAKTIDIKDKYTNGHSQRVADYTAMLAKELGYGEEEVEKYRNIALLHDIGKIFINSEVLNKNGPLSEQEFNLIKSHSAQGYKVLKDISIMPELAIGAGQHHERPDGKGYPNGLKGDQIERVAQIIAVADTFDAMYSDRPYRKRMNFDRAVSIIKEVSGTQLESDVVDAFLRIVDRGGLRAEDDDGGGSTEDINNIHMQQKRREEKAKENEKEKGKK